MDGDGVMDYFWLSEHGRGWGYLSKGQGENMWDDLGEIATAPEGHDRNQVRMGMLTSSGRADYIVVDDDTGLAVWWENLGGEKGDWHGWATPQECATGPWKEIVDFGWHFHGRNVRFAE